MTIYKKKINFLLKHYHSEIVQYISDKNKLISVISAVIFAVYIAYDTQLIVGGKHKKRQYHPKEYILAALGLYQDVMSLFLDILSLLDDKKK